MKLIYKIWLAGEGKTFGAGPCELLERTRASGSLNRAAQEMGMSYSKAWTLIRRAEDEFGFPLLCRKAGGALGGGSTVTGRAEDLIRCYREFCREAETSLLELYAKHFSCFEAGFLGPRYSESNITPDGAFPAGHNNDGVVK